MNKSILLHALIEATKVTGEFKDEPAQAQQAETRKTLTDEQMKRRA